MVPLPCSPRQAKDIIATLVPLSVDSVGPFMLGMVRKDRHGPVNPLANLYLKGSG